MSNAKITKEAVNKVGEYTLQSKFPGYNARQDRTTLDPSFMVSPSQNVLVGTSGRIGSVKGFKVDGQSSMVINSGILSNYDFVNYKGDYRNLRAGFLSNAGNDGKLQFRYKDANSVVTWIDLLKNLTTVRFDFCDYWDNTSLIKNVLFVDGLGTLYQWAGAVTTLASATTTTVTKQGTNTWAQEGFSPTGTISINGLTATYTGGSATTTLTGVSIDFTVEPAGSVVFQPPIAYTVSSFTGMGATFNPYIIGCGRTNQVYLGAADSNVLYISKVNDFTDYSFTTPTRIAGEGAEVVLDDVPRAFVPQEVTANDGGTTAYDMWISEGLNNWGIIRMTLNGTDPNTTAAYEVVQHIRLKVSQLQAAQSARLVSKMKNHIMYIANDNTANFIGYISYEYIPTIVDFGYPVIEDFNTYNFTDGQIFYFKNYAFVSVPKDGLIRMYNMTDQTKDSFSQYKAIEDVTQMPWFWECPITYPISGFYEVDGEIYGHGYTTSESYKLFTGNNFNGQDIESAAVFAYDSMGDRTQTKGSNEIWVDGYIQQNTEMQVNVKGDVDACSTTQVTTINGSDIATVCFPSGGYHSLGQVSLGSQPLGGIYQGQFSTQGKQTIDRSVSELPAYFHAIKTYLQVPYYLEQIYFYTKGVDLAWEIISFGTNKKFTTEGNNAITE